MTVQAVVGEIARFRVSSESAHDQSHLVDLLEHECGCASWVCNNRRYRQQYGHNFTCKHIKVARESFMDDILESLREHQLSR